MMTAWAQAPPRPRLVGARVDVPGVGSGQCGRETHPDDARGDRDHATTPPARGIAACPRLRIDREYAEPLDVEELARGAHMSAGHLSREFRLAYGESP